MRTLLIDVDSKIENLALMKLSRFHQNKGDSTNLALMNLSARLKRDRVESGFPIETPNKIYVSCIFQQNLQKAKELKERFPNSDFNLGGPALWEPNHIPEEAEHLMPDYNLYPNMNYSMGYTSRGCPNNCPFCIVPKLEGSFYEYAPISEFHNPDFRNLLLFDNNFFYSKLWDKKIDYIEEGGLRVSLFQGIDARTITTEKILRLKDIGAYNRTFKRKCYYFSWDLMTSSDKVIQGLQTVIDAGIKPYQIMVYVLVGFNTTHLQDYYRFKVLREMGVDPFIMKYNGRKDDEFLNHLARWIIKRVYKSDSFSNYKPLSDELRREVQEIEVKTDEILLEPKTLYSL